MRVARTARLAASRRSVPLPRVPTYRARRSLGRGESDGGRAICDRDRRRRATSRKPAALSTPSPRGGLLPPSVLRRYLRPLGAAYDAVGRWLVAHPAPQWVVNSPAKTKFTSFLASVLDPEFDLDASVAPVEKLIASDDVVVFSATYCPFSAAAKRALTAEGVPFTAVEWNETKGGAGFAPALAALTGRSSIPHVFVCGKSVGGCNDGNPGIRPLIASGGLDEALAGCSQKTRDARAAFLEARGDNRA